jgi:hypothetical protein
VSAKVQEQVTVYVISNGFLVADRGEQVIYCHTEAAVAMRVEQALLEEKKRADTNTGRLSESELEAMVQAFPTKEELASYTKIGDPGAA